MLEEMVNFMNTQSHSFLGREGEFVFAKRCERAPNIPTTIESRDTEFRRKASPVRTSAGDHCSMGMQRLTSMRAR
jgi:hypothetical protein